MAHTIVRLFRSHAEAQKAREALIESGVPEHDIDTSVQGDEAGAMKGNFVIGNHKDAEGRKAGAGNYADNYHNVEFGGVWLVAVEITQNGAANAAAILEQFGGRAH